MKRFARSFVLSCCLFSATGPAAAAPLNIPDPAHSLLPSRFIAIEGSTAGVPDNCSDGRCSDYLLTIRDFANQPIAGSTVVIDFSGCPDIFIACDQLNGVTGQTFLAGKKVSGTTNAIGQFVFKVQGAATSTAPSSNITSAGTVAGVPCATVYADGVTLSPALVVAAYDVNAAGSPTAAVDDQDYRRVQAESLRVMLGATARARDDYNRSGTVTVSDVAISVMMTLDQIAGTGSQRTGPYCP